MHLAGCLDPFLFTREEAEAILQIPLVKHLKEDHRVWGGESTREYTVRNDYRSLLKEISSLDVETIDITNKVVLKSLWKTDLPTKIKITNWRIYNNNIPIFNNLKF